MHQLPPEKLLETHEQIDRTIITALVRNVHIGLILEQTIMGYSMQCSRDDGHACEACVATQSLLAFATSVCKSGSRKDLTSTAAGITLLCVCAGYGLSGILQGALGHVLTANTCTSSEASERQLDMDSISQRHSACKHVFHIDPREPCMRGANLQHLQKQEQEPLKLVLRGLQLPASAGVYTGEHALAPLVEHFECVDMFPAPAPEAAAAIGLPATMPWACRLLSDLVYLLCGLQGRPTQGVGYGAAFALLQLQPTLLNHCAALEQQFDNAGTPWLNRSASALLATAALMGCPWQLETLQQSLAAPIAGIFMRHAVLYALYLASAVDNVPAIEAILRKGWVGVDEMFYATTALHTACFCGSLAAAEALIAAGASCALVLNVEEESDGAAAHWAARGGHLPLLQLAVQQPNAAIGAETP